MRRKYDCYVYFVRRADGEGPVKIGCSCSPKDRLASLMVWSPYLLQIIATIPGDERLEWAFHAKFADQHSHREWFNPSAELDRVMAQVADGVFDVASLPEPKRIGYGLGRKWVGLTRERFDAERALKKLAAAGLKFEHGVDYLSYRYWRLPDDQRWARVREVQAFLAEHAEITRKAA